jgi:hypothetical protein
VLAAGSHGIVTFEVGSDGTLTYAGTEENVPSPQRESPFASRKPIAKPREPVRRARAGSRARCYEERKSRPTSQVVCAARSAS